MSQRGRIHLSHSNIQIMVYIGEYKLALNIPKETKVSQVISIVKSYQKLHEEYGPMHSHFIGLGSNDNNEIIDYWLTQMHFDFTRFRRKVSLRTLYSEQKKVQKLSLNDYQFLKYIGDGAYGKVFMVRNKVTGYIFALKQIFKESIQNLAALESVMRQQKILKELPANKFTVHFHASFESEQHFNFLFDYCPGGQLFLHLQNRKHTDDDALIYFCQILLALELLHQNHVLYRDLKPQNILVDADGHLRLADFGLSKCGFTEDHSTESRVGSEEYMAPEVICGQNYSFSADFYSLGAILLQLLNGLPPYYELSKLPYEQKIRKMKQQPIDLSCIANEDARELIQNLLELDAQNRLSDFREIKQCSWLRGVDWKAIHGKTINVPFVPNIYEEYLCEDFQHKQNEIMIMNKYHNDNFENLFQFFDYVKNDSKYLVLGQQPKDITGKKKVTKNNKSITTSSGHSKGSISINLFEKEDSTNSYMSFEPTTTRNGKQNIYSGFKAVPSKKNLKPDIPTNISLITNRNPTRSTLNSHEISKNSSKSKEKLTLRSNNRLIDKIEKDTKDIKNIKDIKDMRDTSKSKSKSKILCKSKSKEKSAVKPFKKEPNKIKKELLPATSYKIKLK